MAAVEAATTVATAMLQHIPCLVELEEGAGAGAVEDSLDGEVVGKGDRGVPRHGRVVPDRRWG